MNIYGQKAQHKRQNLQPEVAKARDTTQLIKQVHEDCELFGIELDGFAELERVMINNRTLTAAEAFFGGEKYDVKGGSWVIAIVRNKDGQPRSLAGALYMEGMNLVDEGGPAFLAAQDPGMPGGSLGSLGSLAGAVDPGAPGLLGLSGVIPEAAPTTPGSLTSPGSDPHEFSVAQPIDAGTSSGPVLAYQPQVVERIVEKTVTPKGAVVPGTNEFAVLLMHSDMARLMGVIKNTAIVSDSEKPNLLKRFEDAFKRASQA